MMMYLIRLLAACAVIAVMSGCGLFASDDPYGYKSAKPVKPLEMPEGLQMSKTAQVDAIPESGGKSAQSVEELELPPQILNSADLKELEAKEQTETAPAKPQSVETPATPRALTMLATKDTDGNSLLMVDEKFDKVWPLVQPALEKLGFNIDDSSRGQELYAISKALPTYEFTDKEQHIADEKPEVKEEFQIHVKPADEKTQITVHNKFGQREGSGLADHLLLQIKELMENPE
jgi:uncharacterized lipoprotein